MKEEVENESIINQEKDNEKEALMPTNTKKIDKKQLNINNLILNQIHSDNFKFSTESN